MRIRGANGQRASSVSPPSPKRSEHRGKRTKCGGGKDFEGRFRWSHREAEAQEGRQKMTSGGGGEVFSMDKDIGRAGREVSEGAANRTSKRGEITKNIRHGKNKKYSRGVNWGTFRDKF